jgi:hypothetical protein
MIPSIKNLDKIIDFQLSLNKRDDIFIYCSNDDLEVWKLFFNSLEIRDKGFFPDIESCTNTILYTGFKIHLKLL